MKFQILFFALFLAFSPFMQAQDAPTPSEAEREAVFNYIKKYNSLDSLILLEMSLFNQIYYLKKLSGAEIKAKQKVHVANINEAIKKFTAIPAPSACKEVRLKMLAVTNCTKILVNKIVNDIYQRQANQQAKCAACKEATYLAFKLKENDPEVQNDLYWEELDKMMKDLSLKYNFKLIDQKEHNYKVDMFTKGQAYLTELIFINSYFIDAHIEVVEAINNTISINNAATIDALEKAISKYQNECATGHKLLLAFPKEFNGNGSLWKVTQELDNFTNDFGQKTLPSMLAAFSKKKQSQADVNIINAGVEEYSKAQPLINKSATIVLDFIAEVKTFQP